MSDPYQQNPYDKTPYGQPQQPYGDATGQPGYGYPQYPQAPNQAGYGYPAQPGYLTPEAPYGYDPYGRPYSDKSKVVAGVLQLFVGTLGVGRFYTGHVGIALGQLFTCGGLGIWALIDGIILLTGDHTDSQGRPLRG